MTTSTSILEYLEKNNPAVAREYERFSSYDFSNLTIGTYVLTLRSGFCGGSGELRKVTEIHADKGYVILSHLAKESRSILSKNDAWWKDVCILSDSDVQIYKNANRKDYDVWELKTIGRAL